MPHNFDPSRPAFDQDGRKADIISISPLAMPFPISAMIQTGIGKRSPMTFSRCGISRKGPAIYLTNPRDGSACLNGDAGRIDNPSC